MTIESSLADEMTDRQKAGIRGTVVMRLGVEKPEQRSDSPSVAAMPKPACRWRIAEAWLHLPLIAPLSDPERRGRHTID
jgi:hypothetical protein